ncbi:MAG: hypothetical protein GY780_00895 [bacterium]|nr:hypothetical protein [bacterium]
MRKVLLLLVLVSLCFCAPAYSQCNEDPDEIGVFWSPDSGDCLNCEIAMGLQPLSAYVILSNASLAGGVSSFEFSLVNADGSYFMPPPSDFIVGYVLPPGSLNVSLAPDFIVGCASPIPWAPSITLVEVQILASGAAEWCFGVKAGQFASIPGQMTYTNGSDPYDFRIMNPNNGPDASDYAMACLNHPDCDPGPVATKNSNWGSVKSLYR